MSYGRSFDTKNDLEEAVSSLGCSYACVGYCQVNTVILK